jgi:GMP synthase-like glutamine amidotransferase
MHWILTAQTGEGVQRRTIGEGIMAGQIGMAIVGGDPKRHNSSLAVGLIYKYAIHVHKYVKRKIMHIAVLVANTDESEFAQAHPKDGAKFAALLQAERPEWRVSAFSVKDGAFPADGARFDGWIITGSPASVHDSAAWVGRLFGLIREIVARGAPLFGACFGHQAIAVALGGVVGDNPGGWVFGAVQTEIEGAQIRLYAAHREQVLTMPEGAIALGGNADCAVGSFAIGSNVLTTQYHPEMTHGFMVALTEEMQGKLPDQVLNAARASLCGAVADQDKIARRIVRFFETAQLSSP